MEERFKDFPDLLTPDSRSRYREVGPGSLEAFYRVISAIACRVAQLPRSRIIQSLSRALVGPAVCLRRDKPALSAEYVISRGRSPAPFSSARGAPATSDDHQPFG